MTTLVQLKSQHPEWCFSCGKWWLEAEGLHTCHEHPVIAALLAKAEEDEARIKKQIAAATERARQINQLKGKLRNPEKRFADLQAQLTVEREAHEVTRKALEEADKALIYWEDCAIGVPSGALAAYTSALARETERQKGKGE